MSSAISDTLHGDERLPGERLAAEIDGITNLWENIAALMNSDAGCTPEGVREAGKLVVRFKNDLAVLDGRYQSLVRETQTNRDDLATASNPPGGLS
jgi:hypothetical protein